MNNIYVERVSNDSFKIDVEEEGTLFLFDDELEQLYHLIWAALEDKYRGNDDNGEYEEGV